MDTHVAAHSITEPEIAAPRARLPGEPEEAPLPLASVRAGVTDGAKAMPGVADGDRPPPATPPTSRRRQKLLAGAAVVALAAASASAFLISPYNHVYPLPRMASAVRNAASSAGIQIPPGIVAPAAKLAAIAVLQPAPNIHQPYTPPPLTQEIHELLALHTGEPVPSQPRAAPPSESVPNPATPPGRPPGPIATRAQPLGQPVQSAVRPASERPALGLATSDHPDLGGPPPGYIAREPGSLPTLTLATPATTMPTAAPPAPSAPPPAVVTAAVVASPGVPADPPSSDKPSSAGASGGATPGMAPGAPASPAKANASALLPVSDVLQAARELHPAPMTPKDQVAVLGMVTELATMIADLRSETSQLRSDMARSAAENTARLGDLERRMAMGEARTALGRARDAASALPVADPAPSPPPPDPAVTVMPVRVTRADTALLPATPGTSTRYRVQAASPGLAMLAQVDRGGGDGAQVEVRVGDNLPGYGRVKSIGQKGSSWVVTTDHGDIS